jgi:TrmH family RNA methyltransferase
MLVKSQVKYIQSLGHKKFRDADGVFVAEGPKIVSELIHSNNLRLVQCFATGDWLLSHEDMQKGREKLFIRTNEKELERISFHSAPNQVLAIFTKPVFNKIKTSEGLTLLLDNIQNPGNFGTILRTADWFGIRRLVCSQNTVDVFNPKVVQSAMGSLVRVEILYMDLEDYIRLNPGIPLYASSLEGEDLRDKLVLSSAMLLVGNESEGVSPSLESLAIKKIRIPGKGAAESLNVAVATGILLSRIEWIN